MATKNSKRLVIDASIGRAAGTEITTSEQGRICRTFLEDVLKICHKAVMTKEILAEWQKHESVSANIWRVSMFRKGKLIFERDLASVPEIVDDIRSAIENDVSEKSIQDILLKDLRLVSAALLTDHRIISLDNQARKHYSNLARNIPELQKIVWVNPCKTEDDSDKWLQNGCKLQKAHKLSVKEK
jgi:hypothetical protein